MELEKVPHYAKLSSPGFPNNAALRQPVGGGGESQCFSSFVRCTFPNVLHSNSCGINLFIMTDTSFKKAPRR